VICVLCEKILCPQAEDFLQLRVLKEEERKIAPQINSGDEVKKLSFLMASNLKTIFADFPEIYLEVSEELSVNRVASAFQLRSCFVGKAAIQILDKSRHLLLTSSGAWERLSLGKL
jgi:hypothetical protein